MKLFGKQNLEVQIEGLQRKLEGLESQLAQAKLAHQKHEASAAKALADAANEHELLLSQLKQAQEEFNQLASDKKQVETSLAKAKDDALTAKDALAKEKAALTAERDAKAKQLAEATAAKDALSKEKAALTAERDAKAKQLAEATASKDALAKEKAALTAERDAKAKQLAEATAAKDALSKEKAALTAERDAKAKQLAEATASKDALAKEKAALQAELKAAQAQVASNAQTAKASEPLKAELAKLKAELEKHKPELDKLKAEKDKLAKEAQQTTAKFEDAAQENELLLLQLMQAQEELVEYYEQKGQFEQLYEGYKARWDRLEKRLPNYVDFGAVELLAFDNVADIPTLTWRIKDYAQAGVAIAELQFTTLLHDGHPGIGLAKQGGEPTCFVPRLLTKSPEYLKNFLNYTTSEFKQISAIVPIFEQFEASNWQGFEFPPNFDVSFWRPSLKTLMTQIKALPAVLRYQEVLLKRELINPDYEHLWLEFRGMALGAETWRKFEVRVGAALVQADGFSQHPKFEFPLIDGKTKPFDSWFAESQDDIGAKLELRFALDKQALDTAVLAKLSEADRALVLRVVNAVPDALLKLEAQKAAIHRPWATWVGFARSAVALLKTSRPATAPSQAKLPGPTPAKALPGADTLPPAISSSAVAVAVAPKRAAPGAKVLSFNSKPLAAAKPKTAANRKTLPKNKSKGA